MSDPSVYNDRREAAEVGRRLKDLESRTSWRRSGGRCRGRRGVASRSRAEGARRRVGAAPRRARGGAQARARRDRPGRPEGRDPRDPPGRRRRRGGDLGRRRAADALALRGEPRLQDGAALGERERERRLQGGRLRRQGRRRLLGLQVRRRHASRPARSRDRVAGPDPHLDRDRRGHARGGGGRGRDRRQRPQDRRLPLDRAGRPERQHDRLGRPDHPPADRDRGRDAGREVTAPEQGEGDAGAPRADLRGGARAPAGRALGDARVADRLRRAGGEDPHLQLPGQPRDGPPGEGDAEPGEGAPGGLDDFTEALQAEDRRRALEE